MTYQQSTSKSGLSAAKVAQCSVLLLFRYVSESVLRKDIIEVM